MSAATCRHCRINADVFNGFFNLSDFHTHFFPSDFSFFKAHLNALGAGQLTDRFCDGFYTVLAMHPINF